MTDKEKLEKVKAEIERVKKNQEGVFTEYTDWGGTNEYAF